MVNECAICYRRRRDRTMLECQHEICTDCWETWASKERTLFGRTIPTCPICRAPQPNRAPANVALLVAAVLIWLWMSHSSPA